MRIKLISSRCLRELWYALFDYSVYCTSMHSYICMVTPDVGTLAETREGPDVEPNLKIELVDPSRR
jgi:hypothetical protein